MHLEGLNAGPETLTVYSAPAPGMYDAGVPTRKPLAKLVLRVPAFSVGAPAIVRTVACDARPK